MADIPTGTPEALGAHGPPTPLLALDLRAHTLTRVKADGQHAHLPAAGSRMGFPLLSPDRRRIVAHVSDEDERGSVGVLDLDGEVQDRLGTADCAGWLPDGTLVVGTAVGDAMELTTPSSPGRRLPVSGGDCPRPGRGPDEVLVQRGRTEREEAFVVAQGLHDGRVRQEFRLERCNVVSPSASPARTEVAFAVTCDELLRSGIWVADASGGLHHVLACVCGVPAFSPDGAWLAAVVVPTDRIGHRNTERLAFVRRDGSGGFRLPFGALSFPMWPAP